MGSFDFNRITPMLGVNGSTMACRVVVGIGGAWRVKGEDLKNRISSRAARAVACGVLAIDTSRACW